MATRPSRDNTIVRGDHSVASGWLARAENILGDVKGGLGLVAEGYSDDQIAGRLVISLHTVHRHVANIRTKLDQPSRAAAVAHASRTGLI